MASGFFSVCLFSNHMHSKFYQNMKKIKNIQHFEFSQEFSQTSPKSCITVRKKTDCQVGSKLDKIV